MIDQLNDATLGGIVRKSLMGIQKGASVLQQSTIGAAAIALCAVASELQTDSVELELRGPDCDGQPSQWRLELRRL